MLHQLLPGDQQYLQRAQAQWKWFAGSGMIGKKFGLIADGLNKQSNGSCISNGDPSSCCHGRYTYVGASRDPCGVL